MKIQLELTERQATALLVRLLSGNEGPANLDVSRPKHYSDVTDAMRALAVALETERSREAMAPPPVTDAPRGRGRPRKTDGPRLTEKQRQGIRAITSATSPKCDGVKHSWKMGRCEGCGEPEPRTCENGYHLNEGGKCARCGKVAES